MTDAILRIPEIRTERLVLRAPRIEDFDAYAAFRASERTRIIGGPYSRDEAWQQLAALVGHWQLRGYGRWIVADRRSDAAMGVVGLFFPEGWPEPEIAWSVFDDFEGHGYAYEFARAAIDHAFGTVGWPTAISLIDPANRRSISLARRLGAVPEGAFDHAGLGAMQVWRHPAPKGAA